MKTIVTTEKSVDQAVADLQEAVAAHKFGVLHVYDLQGIMASKGVEFDYPVWVLEVCNPHHAKTAMTTELDINMALPCRLSVWSDGSQTYIGMIDPSAMLGMLSQASALTELAATVEAEMRAMIEDAK